MPYGAIGRKDGASEHCRFHGRKIRRKREHSRDGNDGILGEAGHRIHRYRRAVFATKPGSAVVQSPLEPVHPEKLLAKIVASGGAKSTRAAGHDEGRDDKGSGLRASRSGSQSGDRPRNFVAEDCGHGKRHFTFDDMQIRVADTAGTNAHQCFARAWLGNGNALNPQRPRDFVQYGGFHQSGTHRATPLFSLRSRESSAPGVEATVPVRRGRAGKARPPQRIRRS